MALAGCTAVQTAATPFSVSFKNVSDLTVNGAFEKAIAYCGQFNRDARPPEGIYDYHMHGTLTFTCANRAQPAH